MRDAAGRDEVLTRIVFTLVCAVTLWAIGAAVPARARATPGLRLATALVAVTAGRQRAAPVHLPDERGLRGRSRCRAGSSRSLGLARFGLPIAITVAVMLDQGRSARALSDAAREHRPRPTRPRTCGWPLAAVLRDPGLVVARRRGGRWEDLAGGPSRPPGADDRRTWTEVAGAGRPPDDAPCCTIPRWAKRRTCSTRPPRPPRSPSASRTWPTTCGAPSRTCARRAPGWRRPPTRSGAGWSATCTTAPSRLWWRCASGVAVARETLDGDPGAAARAPSMPSTPNSAGVLEDLRRLSRGLYPPLLEDRGVVEALRGTAARAPARDRGGGRHRPPAPPGRGRRLLLLQRGPPERDQARGPGHEATVSLSVADDVAAVQVADDGAGFDATPPAHRHRAHRHARPRRRGRRTPRGALVVPRRPASRAHARPPSPDGTPRLSRPEPLPQVDQHGWPQLVLGQHRAGRRTRRRPAAALRAVAETSTTAMPGQARRTRRVASIPSIPGRRTSIRTQVDLLAQRRRDAVLAGARLGHAAEAGGGVHQHARRHAEALLVVDREHAYAVVVGRHRRRCFPGDAPPHTRPR